MKSLLTKWWGRTCLAVTNSDDNQMQEYDNVPILGIKFAFNGLITIRADDK
jgi:hypothetical protein